MIHNHEWKEFAESKNWYQKRDLIGVSQVAGQQKQLPPDNFDFCVFFVFYFSSVRAEQLDVDFFRYFGRGRVFTTTLDSATQSICSINRIQWPGNHSIITEQKSSGEISRSRKLWATNFKMNKDDNTDLNELTDDMHDKRLEESLHRFWQTQIEEMAVLEIGTEQDFKNHNDLPLARIKRIMKSDEDVRMISAEGQNLKVPTSRFSSVVS